MLPILLTQIGLLAHIYRYFESQKAYLFFGDDDRVGASGGICRKVGGSSMLVGTYEHKIDSKARIVLPSKFREELGDCVVSTIGIDNCVSLYSRTGWERVMTKLQDLPFSKSKTRGLLRIMLASAHELPIDSAGRILLPPVLRQHGDLSQDVVFVGVNDHVELWDREKWNEYREVVSRDLSDIAEGVDGF